jgi:hypothetical protein
MTDRVAEYLAKMNAAAAARPNPLLTDAQRAAIAAAGPLPAKTGDLVVDYIAMQRWRESRKPNLLRRP